ncbi:hypothetical protein NDU88_001109 [Pleurodeles waltl]|uniref:Uncharacterized protein n=1 Tax=Pleurodeles waltl TaxID=8319 RepID=A0AAV7SYF1_PLEWA|nr:hypothetical protein NDU88_001109 [Pleurodeles waltl]
MMILALLKELLVAKHDEFAKFYETPHSSSPQDHATAEQAFLTELAILGQSPDEAQLLSVNINAEDISHAIDGTVTMKAQETNEFYKITKSLIAPLLGNLLVEITTTTARLP